MTQKPSLVKGMRDFSPEKMTKRNFIFQNIQKVFKTFGFQPLETPTVENLSVLMGKYGEEGDQLLFKILNSGNFLEKISSKDLEEGYKKITPKIAEKGLRYDLTVPFARFVTMNKGELTFPFKRYQMQPVWRADRPQKGRYREFYQCDADIVGTDSLLCEAEIVAMIHQVFNSLGIVDFSIKINNRKVLTGIAEVIGEEGKESVLAIAIDKLDKIGKEKVEEELQERGFSKNAIGLLAPIFEMKGTNQEKFGQIKTIVSSSATGKKGIEELENIWDLFHKYGLSDTQVELDLTLARGLSYYTGAIFEVKANGISIGSISGGGRYDNLTSSFGLEGVSGVGISFGVDRIYDVMEELSLFPDQQAMTTNVLFCYLDQESQYYALPLLQEARKNNISAEIYPDLNKFKKQLEYADRKKIPFVIIIGSEERASKKLTLKNMQTGEQQALFFEQILILLKNTFIA